MGISASSQDKVKAQDCPLNTEIINNLAPVGQAQKQTPFIRMLGYFFVIQTHTHTGILFTLPNEKP